MTKVSKYKTNSQLLQTVVNGSAYLIVLISGGRSSAMMARHIQTSEKYKDFEKLYVFCNTGQERPQTIKTAMAKQMAITQEQAEIYHNLHNKPYNQ